MINEVEIIRNYFILELFFVNLSSFKTRKMSDDPFSKQRKSDEKNSYLLRGVRFHIVHMSSLLKLKVISKRCF